MIGTFAGMSLFGYSLDNLSLMALTLSVGFVVDDAIVMLENIVRHIEMGEKPFEAALNGSREIGFTILSMTLSLAAVFIPVALHGRHRRPAAARIRRDHRAGDPVLRLRVDHADADAVQPDPASDKRGASRPLLPRAASARFDRVQAGYEHSLHWTMNHKPLIFGFLASLLATVVLFEIDARGLPAEPTIRARSSPSPRPRTARRSNMNEYQQQAAAIVAQDPNVHRSCLRWEPADRARAPTPARSSRR